MNNISLSVKIKQDYDFINYQTDIFYKQKLKNNKQTPYSLIEEIILKNNTDIDFSDLKIVFEVNDPILKINDILVSGLYKKTQTKISEQITITLDFNRLYELQESLALNVVAKLLKENSQEVLCTSNYSLIFNPIEQVMSGNIIDYRLLSCYVTPNATEVKKVIKKAIEIIAKERKEEPTFIGYHANSIDSVREEMKAIYEALMEQGIAYANPPASFNKFQRVRTPTTVLESKRGTCLDLAILYCACLEAIGLKPILIAIKNHAFAGCFLNDESFEDYTIETVDTIVNRSSRGNMSIELVECTGFPLTSNMSFNDSLISARKNLELYNDIFMAIDIVRCHKSFYRPIPTFGQGEKVKIDFNIQIVQKDELEKQEQYNRGVFEVENFTGNKFEYWAKKLLDLDLKNRLINFKLNNSALQLMVSNSDYIFQHVQNDEVLSLIFINEKNEDDTFATSGLDLYVSDEKKGIFHVLNNEKNYKAMIRKSNSILEETGSNVLYLALGLIHFIPEKSKVGFLAPLFLLPAKGKVRANNGGYILEIIPDEITINTTVLEYIKQNCGISFDDLYSVKKDEIFSKRIEIINTIRSRSSHACQISVDENKVYLSIFSFAHYIMWDDIKRRQDILLENKIIKALVDNTLINDEEEQVDLETNPDDVAVPLGADSSQIKAIIDAEKGESFVLDGPPGTGKSQTIVNMIVNAIYHGKTVLFVAEKMAALDVVKKRIDDLQLGFLCLELHSQKSNKKDMLDHLGKSLEYEKIASPSNFDEATNDLIMRREQLNKLIFEMRKNKYGVSLYDCIINYLNVEKYHLISYPEYDNALNMKAKDLTMIHEQLSYLETLVDVRKELTSNPFHCFQYDYFDRHDIDKLNEDLSKFKQIVTSLQEHVDDIHFAFKKVYLNRNNILLMKDAVSFIKDNDIEFFKFSMSDYEDILNDLETFFRHGEELEEIHDILKPYFKDDIFLNINLEKLNQELLNYEDKLFAKSKCKRKLKKTFKRYLLNKKFKFKKEYDVFKIFEYLQQAKEHLDYLKEEDTPIKFVFNNEQHDYLSCPYKKVIKTLDNTLELMKKVQCLYKNNDSTDIKKAMQDLKRLYSHRQDDYLNEIYLFLQSVDKFLEFEKTLHDKYQYDGELFNKKDDEKYLIMLLENINDMLNNIEESLNVAAFNMVFKQLRQLNFPEFLIEDYRLAKFGIDQLRPRFDACYYYRLIREYTKDDFFKQFNSLIFTDTIKKYGEAIDDYATLIVKETASRATKNYPLSNVNYVGSSKIAQLIRYIKNGGKKTTIRNLLMEYEDLIKTICPVFLMSPMSAAQYLSVKSKKFDIVIFDEASQIPTCEAVGAISRGNSLIVAGDPEQMPPTNFFKSNFDNVEDDQFTYVDDLESLLDDCLAIKMKRNRLLWHYRSKHESLIAFSNNTFYNHDLYTFPSPDNNYSRIEFNYLKNGVYEHGVNKVEAQAIVKKVQSIFKDPKQRNKSIGIVTFNLKQCDLISSMITAMFDKHPSYEKIDNEHTDHLFVKNLENVQGDERDIIIFSIGFGFTKSHKLSMMFGPLSLEKGERRLNVAITRAREKMIIYSSIKGNDINTETAKNKGSSILKDFLNYAEKGSESLIVENAHQTQPKLGIEQYIQQDLKQLGIDSDINVGDSKFRVNVCIKDNNNDYILGILCDGSTYLETPTCKDRNYVQKNMLSKLNWKVMRVYTYDYLQNKDIVIKDIVNAIKNIQDIPLDNIKHVTGNVVFEKKIIEAYKHKRPYEVKQPARICDYNEADLFFDEVKNHLINVIDVEGPIARSLLLERFKTAFGIARAGSKAKKTFDFMMNFVKKERYSKVELFDEFFYAGRDCPNQVECFRESDYTIRSVEQIPSVEISFALQDIITIQGEVSIDDALKALCNLFGYEKVNATTLEKMKKQIDYILKNYAKFRLNDDKINFSNK